MAGSMVKRNIVKIDLDGGNVRRSWINHSIGLADNLGDAFGVEVYRSGEAWDLTGATIMGFFHEPWGNNIVINGGDIMGNMAIIYLPQACYNHEGQFTLALKIVTDRETSTMVIFDGMVDNTNTGSAVAPTGTVPTYQEVLAVYDQMLAAKDGSVRFDIVQSLSGVQRLQAQENMGAYYQPQIDTVNGKIGNTALPTTAQTLTGAIAEHEGDLINQQGQITDLKGTTNNLAVDLNTNSGNSVSYQGKGKFKINGTSGSGVGIQILARNITLTPGTYYCGHFGTSLPNGLFMQLRDYTGGSDGGSLAETTGITTVTINANKVGLLRLYVPANTTFSNVEICPYIAKAEDGENPYQTFVPAVTAVDFLARYGDSFALKARKNPSTDFNDFIEEGSYTLAYGTTYTNCPSETSVNTIKMLTVYREYIQEGLYRIQILYDYTNQKIYMRRKYGAYPGTWDNWSIIAYNSKEDIKNVWDMEFLYGCDVDTVLTAKLYRGNAASETYTNLPSEVDNLFMLDVFGTTGSYRIQKLTVYQTGKYKVFIRVRSGATPTWSTWEKVYDENALSHVWDMTYLLSCDLDTVLNGGHYRGNAASYTYTNKPSEVDNLFMLDVYSVDLSSYRIQKLTVYETGKYKVFIRVRSGATPTWNEWEKVYDENKYKYLQKKNDVYKTTLNKSESTTENKGNKITVLSYNVAQYNNDTATPISDEKVAKFKTMLSMIKPDFICLQEARTYIDYPANTKKASEYIFKPVYPYSYMQEAGLNILSKTANNVLDSGLLQYSSMERFVAYVLLQLDNKKFLAVSTHPVSNYNGTGSTSAESIAMRANQYQEVLQWVSGETDMKIPGTSTDVHCPSWDYCVICGDFNSHTDTDKTNLVNYATAKGFSLACGQWMSWLETTENGNSIDNILCSSNMIINSVLSYGDLYNDLYSDHYPLAIEATLLT